MQQQVPQVLPEKGSASRKDLCLLLAPPQPNAKGFLLLCSNSVVLLGQGWKR